MEIQEKTVYTMDETAQILKLNTVTVERKIRRGEIPAIKIGREYRLLGRDILSLFDWEGIKNNMWKTEYTSFLNEMRADGKGKGITEEDISMAIEKVRRREFAKV